MNATANIRTSLIVVIAAVVFLVASQIVFAQSDDTDVPQWVLDRQQYETTYIYNPESNSADVASIPQWALDRQQYETTFIYPDDASATAQLASVMPQWVLDRQQYETTYQYPENLLMPMMIVENTPGS